jgi:glycosyltransferase involved in cell wall biosynthesis
MERFAAASVESGATGLTIRTAVRTMQTPPRGRSMTSPEPAPTICFVGMANLPMLAPEFGHHRAGGTELQQALLAKALARHGFSVSMVVADYGQPDGAVYEGVKTYKAYDPAKGVPVLRFVHPRWSGLWAALKKADADIYYTSAAGGHLGQIVMFARLHGRKVVFRTASNSDCDRRLLLVHLWRNKQLYRYGLKRADLVLAQTLEQQAALAKNFARDSRVVTSMTESARPRRALADRDIDVLWVGNIRSVKRPDLLLALARRLPAIRFHMIGGPMPRAEKLYDAVRSEALTLPNVRFHGLVPYHEIAQFYERARVYVSTSDVEGFPNSYLQAWAHGTPVVAFLDPDQLVARNGLGCAPTSVEEMCTCIQGLMADPHQWQAASVRSGQFMDSRFSESSMVAAYLEALADLGPARSGASRPKARSTHAA